MSGILLENMCYTCHFENRVVQQRC